MEAGIESRLRPSAENSKKQSNVWRYSKSEAKALREGKSGPFVDVEAIKEEGREEAQKESEAELNDLLVCLGQEQTKVEKLSSRLAELGEDVDTLLEGIGDDVGLDEDSVDEEEE
ncbi:Golgin candidate [Thalictrum thalictroides]|uniref:Golgin candidate n=1 Tax=Thalictrum thalictroides TaxID=46969 RepID=A0A7J6VVA4_THATH|nr:Golgin candidate [Thalictrum thalictroides]